ncbi:MAG: hypothetical protein AAFQ94_09720 [Bacteroidota bacterium]
MKHYWQDIKSILQVIGYIGFYFLISIEDNPLLTIISGICWVAFLVYHIIDKIRYKAHKYQNEIRFPTRNDNFLRMTSLTLGGLITVSFSISLILTMDTSLFSIFFLISGILIFANGLIDTPKGKLKLNSEELTLHGIKNKSEIRDIESISIKDNQILINASDGSKVIQGNLQLNEKWIDRIVDFLKLRLNTDNIKILQA